MKRILFGLLLHALISLPLLGQFKNFLTTKGDKLMDGNTELRFISCNIPNLHYVEDYLPFSGTNPWRLPDDFEIRDAFMAVSYTHLRAHETRHDLVCRLLLEKKKN